MTASLDSGPAGTALIGVVGAGTMGAGIAQVAAVAGRRVLIADAVPGAAERAVGGIRDRVKAQVAKGRLSVDPDSLDLTAVDSVAGLAGCGVVIEAIIEDLAVKRALFASLRRSSPLDTILASNTSSLSPTALAAGLTQPERLVGLHFFNPVPAMKLVEVISGLATAPDVADAAADLATAWGKTVVRSTATPGFIVNRIARPFYAEAWRLYEEHAAAPQHIDAVLTGAGGFRMGPFALMDLIGHDVNEAVTRSVWTAFGHDPRFAPVAGPAGPRRGRLARPQGRPRRVPGDGAPAPATPRRAAPHPRSSSSTRPATTVTASRRRCGPCSTGPASAPCRVTATTAAPGSPAAWSSSRPAPSSPSARESPPPRCPPRSSARSSSSTGSSTPRPPPPSRSPPSDGCPPAALAEATGLLQAARLDVYVIEDTPGLIVTRTVAMLANLAADALACRVASEPDIDTAMRLGVNYPLGPLAWARQWGIGDHPAHPRQPRRTGTATATTAPAPCCAAPPSPSAARAAEPARAGSTAAQRWPGD